MSGNVTIEYLKNHVFVKIEGDPLSALEIASTLSQAVELVDESHADIVIFREKPVKQTALMVNFYHYAQTLAKLKFRGKLALAFPEDMHHDNLDFFVIAALNQGVNIELFANIDEAISWVSNGDDEAV